MLSNRWCVLALLFAVRTGMAIQFQAVPALSPLFLKDFAVSIADIGLLIGLYQAPGIVLAFPGGIIGQRLGDVRAVLTGLGLMIAGGLIMTMAPAWPMQIGGRLLAGFGGILINVLLTKMVADWFAGKELATAMAIFINSWPFGIALALVALPLLADAFGLAAAQSAVAAYLTLALIAFAVLYRAPDAAPKAAGRSVWPGHAALLGAAMAGLIWGLYNASIGTVFGFGPLMLVERGWTNVAASSTTSVVLWLVAFSVPLGGYLADRTGRGSAILLGGLIGFAAALVFSTRTDAVLPAFILLGLVSGLPAGLIMSLPARILSPETRAAGMGVFFTVFYVMQVAGPWLAGSIAAAAGTASVSFYLGAFFLCAACVVLFIFWRLESVERLRPGVGAPEAVN